MGKVKERPWRFRGRCSEASTRWSLVRRLTKRHRRLVVDVAGARDDAARAGIGVDVDGQVLVFHDVVGLYDRFVPKFVKQYTNVAQSISDALSSFVDEVNSGHFPAAEHTYNMDEKELMAFLNSIQSN